MHSRRLCHSKIGIGSSIMSYENEVATCMKDFMSYNRPLAALVYVFSYYRICYAAVIDCVLIYI